MGDPKRENQRRRGRTTPRKSCSQARQALWPCDRVKLKLTHCRFPADHAFGVARITIVFTPCLRAITAQIFLSAKTCFQSVYCNCWWERVWADQQRESLPV